MLKLTKRNHFDAFSTQETSPSPFAFAQVQQNQLKQQQQNPFAQSASFLQSQQPQQQQQQQQQMVEQNSYQTESASFKRTRLTHNTSAPTRSDYSFFNDVPSPISEIVSSLDKLKQNKQSPIKQQQQQQPRPLIQFSANSQQQQQQQSQINNNKDNSSNNNKSSTTNSNSSGSTGGGGEKLFTLEEVKHIIKLALEEHEAKLRREYENIVQNKLMEQFQCFSKYNEDYISRQVRDSEFSYMS